MKAIIFDCDGTLADSMPVHYVAWRQTAEKYGMDFPEQLFYDLGGVSAEAIAEILAQRSGVEIDAAAVAHEKELLYGEHLENGLIKPIDKILSIARENRGKLPMAVASGTQRRWVHKTLECFGIFDWFGAIVCAEDVTNGKPAPDPYLLAAKLLGADPADCVVYEDADPGIRGATAAGMRVYDVRNML